jgi:hypothetical protein
MPRPMPRMSRYPTNVREVINYLTELQSQLHGGRVGAYHFVKEDFVVRVDSSGGAQKVPLRGKAVLLLLEWPLCESKEERVQ